MYPVRNMALTPVLEDTPENRTKLYKECLRQARICLLNAQGVVRPFDIRYQKLTEVISQLEAFITEKGA